MDWTPVDWEKIFTDEPADKTAVLVAAQPAQLLRDVSKSNFGYLLMSPGISNRN